jgi:hypothetical protein
VGNEEFLGPVVLQRDLGEVAPATLNGDDG